jgi:hypothetical protein
MLSSSFPYFFLLRPVIRNKHKFPPPLGDHRGNTRFRTTLKDIDGSIRGEEESAAITIF